MRTSLRAQTIRLLLLTASIAILISTSVVWFAREISLDALTEREAAALWRHYETRLADTRKRLNDSAQRLRTQIEFMRIGELPQDVRAAKLRALFNAMGEFRDFSAFMLTDSSELPIFLHGCPVMLQSGLDTLRILDFSVQNVLVGGTCTDNDTIYSVTHVPIWLGAEGKGLMLLAAALDNAWLKQLAERQERLYLYHQGRIKAASEGQAGLSFRVDPAAGKVSRKGESLQLILPLDAVEGMAGPVLVVRHPITPLWPIQDTLLGVGLVSSVLLILIWLTLGRALGGHVRRLQSLARGAEHFEKQFHRDAAWQKTIEELGRREDEIAQLAHTLDHLMQETEARHQEAQAYQKTLDLLEEVVLELDPAGVIQRASAAWYDVFGKETTPLGKPLTAFVHPEDALALTTLMAALASQEKQQATMRLRLAGREGEERWLELRLTRTPEGENLRGVLRDITQHYLQERRITHMALHDALTGLPNRVLLEDRLEVALSQASRSGHKVALGFIDLDHFKYVNDTLGHNVGDQLLVALSDRLRKQLRSSDTLARWGGDEFVVLLPDMPSIGTVREVLEKLKRAIEAPLKVEENEFNVTFSAGFAIYPDDSDDPETLLAQADRAMFHAKAQGRNNLQLFRDMSNKGHGRKEMHLQQRLVTAVRERRIENHYQPLIDAVSGKVVGVEALARWFEPDLGWVSPARFIPMTENLGIIRDLGEQVWRQALADLSAWGRDDLGLSVNLSKRQLFMPDFTEKILKDLAKHFIDPRRITLEVTESIALTDVEYALDRLRQLKNAGLRIALDDFGTGYSSLSQLHELPVSELKIDQSFVRRLSDPKGARIIQTILSLGIWLDLKTVAEGVEDAWTAEMLAEMGVDVLQGWHFARPMPADTFVDWLASYEAGNKESVVLSGLRT